MIHHYTQSTHDRTGTYRSVPGAGSHPSPAWLAARGWYEVADRPEPPTPTGYLWQAADPAYILVDSLSVPQGAWVVDQSPTEYETLRDAHRAGFTAFRAAFLGLASELIAAGHSLPDPLTFRDLGAMLVELGGEWVLRGVALRSLYDEVLYAVHGDPQAGYRILPALLADESLS